MEHDNEGGGTRGGSSGNSTPGREREGRGKGKGKGRGREGKGKEETEGDVDEREREDEAKQGKGKGIFPRLIWIFPKKIACGANRKSRNPSF